MHSKHEVDRQRGRRRVGNKGSMLSRTEPPRREAEAGANTAFRASTARNQDQRRTPPRSCSRAPFHALIATDVLRSRAVLPES